ncbi:MAG: FkbM family methyltransferase [Candidatus Aminicenantes bacterium]|nr:FkbM family methyltransferase [Candidatus Aminicenantes bacterium]
MYHSQFGQDKFVMDLFHKKRNGFFVDIGAYDGKAFSNTYSLEKLLDWKGICVEPGDKFFDLHKNRTCLCIKEAVGPDSHTIIDFLYYDQDPLLSGNIRTLSSYIKNENLREAKVYKMKTISLYDLLFNNDAPKYIDYLSIDTEGYEYEILKNFDFDAYKFGAITVEYNNGNKDIQKSLHSLLKRNGYSRVAQIKLCEDWYVAKELYKLRLVKLTMAKEIERTISRMSGRLEKITPRFHHFIKKRIHR